MRTYKAKSPQAWINQFMNFNDNGDNDEDDRALHTILNRTRKTLHVIDRET